MRGSLPVVVWGSACQWFSKRFDKRGSKRPSSPWPRARFFGVPTKSDAILGGGRVSRDNLSILLQYIRDVWSVHSMKSEARPAVPTMLMFQLLSFAAEGPSLQTSAYDL